jgi:Raf kinase inhibitor-like YbhB/YbcL family protein
MKIISPAFENGKIAGKYGKESSDQQQGIPQLSFPVAWEDLPEGTKSIALVFVDYDNVIGEGFIWLHWLAANISADKTGIEEDASRHADFIQGKNTWAFQLGTENPVCNRYGGPSPEDRPHEYNLEVYALSDMLNLKDGYYYNEFLREIRGKVLDKQTISGFYQN